MRCFLGTRRGISLKTRQQYTFNRPVSSVCPTTYIAVNVLFRIGAYCQFVTTSHSNLPLWRTYRQLGIQAQYRQLGIQAQAALCRAGGVGVKCSCTCQGQPVKGNLARVALMPGWGRGGGPAM